MADSQVHGGNIWATARALGCVPGDILDFSANINPLGPPMWLRPVMARALAQIVHYPEPRAITLRQMAAKLLGRTPDEVVAGNGSSELLYAVPRVCLSLGLRRALLPAPCYVDYVRACTVAGLEVCIWPLRPEVDFALDWTALAARLNEPALVILGQPGNPTGLVLDPTQVLALAQARPESFFVVDEAFADFVPDLARLGKTPCPNLFVLHSLTKAYALPGLRLGLGYGSASFCSRIEALLPDWSVNALAQAVGQAALADTQYLARTVNRVSALREELRKGLLELGLTVWPGRANYLLCRHGSMPAAELRERMLARRVLIRDCGNYVGLDPYFFRVAVRPAEENFCLLSALREISALPGPRPERRKPTPALMVQGLSSSAGKSVLAAALCRIFAQDGLRVAPFKAQNMSSYAHLTDKGEEMSRAQALQARACGLVPDVRMNPVLLKPSSLTGSQVIVLGKTVGQMQVHEYIRFKSEVFTTITSAYDQLAAQAQIMVLEGAGSPAEVNLKAHDVVNMAMARYARARVLLVGDIDRGGVFASFVGTMEVLEEWERSLVAGFVINRFRGQQDLLGPALDYVREFTGVDTLGVVPYLDDLGLPEEDSLGFSQIHSLDQNLDAALDRLANVVRQSLDMERIYRLLD